MFQHFRRAPLAGKMPAPLLAGHAFHRRLKRLFQLFQAEIHGATLTLARGSGQEDFLFRTSINHTSI
jgi:hypothetical protein